ncbi:hypothetical protein JW710_00090 [Candidatus Dojkabacteria bacterium]|nr:hypothetical protein [Candidatus Dojkabacteria bacterium]
MSAGMTAGETGGGEATASLAPLSDEIDGLMADEGRNGTENRHVTLESLAADLESLDDLGPEERIRARIALIDAMSFDDSLTQERVRCPGVDVRGLFEGAIDCLDGMEPFPGRYRFGNELHDQALRLYRAGALRDIPDQILEHLSEFHRIERLEETARRIGRGGALVRAMEELASVEQRMIMGAAAAIHSDEEIRRQMDVIEQLYSGLAVAATDSLDLNYAPWAIPFLAKVRDPRVAIPTAIQVTKNLLRYEGSPLASWVAGRLLFQVSQSINWAGDDKARPRSIQYDDIASVASLSQRIDYSAVVPYREMIDKAALILKEPRDGMPNVTVIANEVRYAVATGQLDLLDGISEKIIGTRMTHRDRVDLTSWASSELMKAGHFHEIIALCHDLIGRNPRRLLRSENPKIWTLDVVCEIACSFSRDWTKACLGLTRDRVHAALVREYREGVPRSFLDGVLKQVRDLEIHGSAEDADERRYTMMQCRHFLAKTAAWVGEEDLLLGLVEYSGSDPLFWESVPEIIYACECRRDHGLAIRIYSIVFGRFWRGDADSSDGFRLSEFLSRCGIAKAQMEWEEALARERGPYGIL